MNIAFISCVSLKKNGTYPARELYISPLFKKSLSYAIKNFDKVYILSAKYGLLELDTIITNYNMTLNEMNEQQKKRWAYKIFLEIRNKIGLEHNFIFLAGNQYRKYLMRVLPNTIAPLSHLGIGQ